jgi:hypothetical protein
MHGGTFEVDGALDRETTVRARTPVPPPDRSRSTGEPALDLPIAAQLG